MYFYVSSDTLNSFKQSELHVQFFFLHFEYIRGASSKLVFLKFVKTFPIGQTLYQKVDFWIEGEFVASLLSANDNSELHSSKTWAYLHNFGVQKSNECAGA